VIVIDVSESRDQPLVLINPEITWRSEDTVMAEEGCLSVPAIYDSVKRHARVNVRALDRGGQPLELQAAELLSICVQHEMDHLLGKVFVDYLSMLKRSRIRSKLLKRQREERRGG
jgi:peptide deformylase